MVAAVDIFILRELRDRFLKHNTTSTHCYDIDTKLNQHSKNGGSGGTSSF